MALAVVCVALVVSLVMTKRSDNAQHESDAGQIAGFSNQLDTANLQIATGVGTIITLSNSLDQSQSASLAFSNQLNEAESMIALDEQQITNLNQQIAAAESENKILGQHTVDLNNQMTNQVAALTQQLASTQASLNQADKDYSLLENRLRIDVAERVVAERKFNDPAQLQAQIENLKENPLDVVTPQSIYAGLDVEVKSNGTFHVISPN
jgi:chromosome segregation ATPase